MESAYIVYTCLMLFTIIFSIPVLAFKPIGMVSDNRYEVLYKDNRFKTILVILIYTLVIGLRYNVGKDYTAYLDWYKELFRYGHFLEDKELGYVLLNEVLYWLNAHYSFLFISLAFLQIFFLFKALERFKFILPWYLFFFFTTLLMFSSMNIMRQTLAYFILFYCINILEEKKYISALFFFLLALSFHTSVLLVAWLYPFLKFNWFKNRIIQVCLLIFFTFFSTNILSLLTLVSSPITGSLGNYQYYLENSDQMQELTVENANGLGLGKYLWFFIDSIIIYYSLILKERFKYYSFTKFYNLYFLGVLLEKMFSGNFIFLRTNDYFLNFRVVILSFLCFYLFNKENRQIHNLIVGGGILITTLFFFYRGIYNSAAQCSPFQLIFSE
ncbi:hypothetical protein GCM10028805_02950 [Spirosoma harenae]